LAREATTQDIDGLDGAPVDRGDVAEVRDRGPIVVDDAGDGLMDLREPDSAGIEDHPGRAHITLRVLRHAQALGSCRPRAPD
jgi:hypothetical protein